jgi:protein SCO1
MRVCAPLFQESSDVTEKAPPQSRLKQVRLLLWLLIVLALVGTAALYLIPNQQTRTPESASAPAKTSFGGPFTLTGADGKPFSSAALEGKPYALYFGFTRCGDVCPTTLSRLVKLRRGAANDQAMKIVFITIDPANDGPKEVGQYATLFDAPIIGLTGSTAQIDQVKKQFGIYAQAVPNAPMGKQMEHTATVLLFDRHGQLAGTIAPDEPDSDALAQIKRLIA